MLLPSVFSSLLHHLLENSFGLLAWSCSTPPSPSSFCFVLFFVFPGNIWRICLGKHIENGKILDLHIVSRHYKLSHGEIEEAAIYPVNSMAISVKKKECIVTQRRFPLNAGYMYIVSNVVCSYMYLVSNKYGFDYLVLCCHLLWKGGLLPLRKKSGIAEIYSSLLLQVSMKKHWWQIPLSRNYYVSRLQQRWTSKDKKNESSQGY